MEKRVQGPILASNASSRALSSGPDHCHRALRETVHHEVRDVHLSAFPFACPVVARGVLHGVRDTSLASFWTDGFAAFGRGLGRGEPLRAGLKSPSKETGRSACSERLGCQALRRRPGQGHG